jgi:hypothetical protein
MGSARALGTDGPALATYLMLNETAMGQPLIRIPRQCDGRHGTHEQDH